MSHQEEQALDREERAGMLAAYQAAMFNLRGLSMPEMAIYLEAVCVSVIREYFRNDPVFTWEDDEDLARNRLFVGTEYPREQMGGHDVRPVIVVGVQGVASTKAMLRDLMRQAPLDASTADRKTTKGDLVNMPVKISVMATNRTLALFLATSMHTLFRTAAEYIRAAFNFNSISAPQTGTPALMKEFTDTFICPVMFNVEVLPKWEQAISEETFTDVVLGIRGIVDRSLMNILDGLNADQVVTQEASL